MLRRKDSLVKKEDALAGRAEAMPISDKHFVFGKAHGQRVFR